MKRVLAFGTLALSIFVVGCGSDSREGIVGATVQNLDTAGSKYANIKEKVDEAVKKTEVGKTPDFKEAVAVVDSLKEIGKQMQKLKLEAEAIKHSVSEEEKKEQADRYKARVDTAIERLTKERTTLMETLATVEQQHKGALKVLREKLTEAEGEFETIARAR